MNEEARKKIEHFGGLLDEHTARLLIEYEKGKFDEEKKERLREKIYKSLNSRIEALVLEVQMPREYRKRNGEMGKILSVKVFVNEREASLTLWDAQIEKIDMGKIAEGKKIIMVNCHLSEGKFGLHINTGKGGVISTESGELIYSAY
jgi:hypothetical protein